MNEEKLKGCRGCMRGYEGMNRIDNCIIFRYGDAKECPCRECLVKVTCNRVCQPLTDMIEVVMDSKSYRNRYSGFLKNLNEKEGTIK